MTQSEYNDGDRNMRQRFAEQIKRFWKESKQKEDTDRSSTREVSGNTRPQDDRTEGPALPPDTQ